MNALNVKEDCGLCQTCKDAVILLGAVYTQETMLSTL